MNLDTPTIALLHLLENWLKIGWLSLVLTVIISIIFFALLAHVVTLLIKRFLNSDNTPIPSSSIFINIGRVIVWIVGICVIASSCFNVDVSGAFTALGIGGIAISLGFQDTLSNLIGGLQLSLTGLVEPGDHIKVDSHQGFVRDVTWRHTSIITTRGEHVIIPNSVINKDALIKLPPQNAVRIGILVKPEKDESLDDVTKKIIKAANSAISAETVLEQQVKVEYLETTEAGYKGTLSFSVAEGTNITNIREVVLDAIADYAQKAQLPKLITSGFLHGSKKRAKVHKKKGAAKKASQKTGSFKPVGKGSTGSMKPVRSGKTGSMKPIVVTTEDTAPKQGSM